MLPPEDDWRAALGESPEARRTKILLVGWEGTLSPLTAGSQRTPPPSRVVDAATPLVAEAMGTVGSLLRQTEISFEGGAGLVARDLAADLERRLCALYVVPMALDAMQAASLERLATDGLARVVAADWVAGLTLFLERLGRERRRVAAWMGRVEMPAIRWLRHAASEVHGPQGSVIEVGFGDGARIFYKPRRVSGEMLWAELVDAVRRAGGPVVAAARALDGEDHGWMSAMSPGVCGEAEHWRRAGAMLCLAQHAGLSDVHMGNVMATAEGPAVVDAECLADPLGDWDGETEAALLATGLLPEGRRGPDQLPDVSGLFGAACEVSGVRVPAWVAAADGGTAVSLRRVRLLDAGNLSAGGRPPLACLPEMLAGYLDAARALRSISDDLLGEGGWVDRMDRGHSPRTVVRETLEYGVVLSRSLFPAAIRSRKEGLRQMLRETTSRVPMPEEALALEVEAMLRLHVPRFHIAAGTGDLVAEDGAIALRDAVGATPAEGVRRRLKWMRRREREDDVRAALAAVLFRSRSL